MREDKPSILNFISRVLVIFSSMVLFQTIVGNFIGEDAMHYSTIFRLGSKGIASETLLQYLLSAIITTSINIAFIKNVMTYWRIVIMLLVHLIIAIGFIIYFKWIPVDDLVAWGVFLLTFVGSVVISLIVMTLKTSSDNKKYDNLLKDYKNKKRSMNNE